MARVLEKAQLIERSIIKKYRKSIWNSFIGAVQEYELIKPNDNIAVCISGGKDSMILAKCMELLQRHSEIPFEIKYSAGVTVVPKAYPFSNFTPFSS